MSVTNLRWNKKLARVERGTVLIEAVMRLWREKLDTLDIARKLDEKEAVVAAALRSGREMERAQ